MIQKAYNVNRQSSIFSTYAIAEPCMICRIPCRVRQSLVDDDFGSGDFLGGDVPKRVKQRHLERSGTGRFRFGDFGSLLYSNDAEIAATSGSATARYVAVTPPSEQPAPVIFVIIALPPGKRNTRSPSVTRSTAPETATAPAPTGEYFAR